MVSTPGKQPSQQQIDELVRRIRSAANPLRIILFGSAARGEWAGNRDLDLLVVMPDGVPRRRTAQQIYRRMIGVGCAVDIVVVTERDIERFGRSPSMVLAPALQEGKTLYAA